MKSLVFLFCLVLCSCAPIYVPNQLQTPLLKEQGEAIASVSVGTSTLDLQAAFSPINHFNILFDFSYANWERHKHKQFQGGISYYLMPNDFTHLELIAGGGNGYGKSYSDFAGSRNKGEYSRYYLQPNIFFLEKYIDMGFAIRAAYITYDDNDNAFHLEPTLIGRIGSENLKLQMQLGWSKKMVKAYEYEDHDHPLILNIGLVYTIKLK